MLKLIAVLLIALTFETVGVVLLSKGLRELEPPTSYRLAAIADLIARGFRNPHVVLGVICEAVFFAGLLYMMSRADVSFVWPLTSLTFVFSAIAAKYYLHEEVSPLRWAGVVLIVCGAGLITYSEKAKERRLKQAGHQT